MSDDINQMLGSWTPIDASGGGLVSTSRTCWWTRIGQLVIAMGEFTFPATVKD
jgi:hypothetical protein